MGICSSKRSGVSTGAVVATIMLLVAVVAAEDLIGGEPEGRIRSAALQLQNGDFVAGQLADSPLGEIVWVSPLFTQSLRFSRDALLAIHFPAPLNPPKIDAEYRFELAGGDVLLGSLSSYEDDCFVIEAPQLGRLRVERGIVQRIIQSKAAELVYWGPRGLDEWRVIGPAESWSEEGGQLATSVKGAGISRGFEFPQQVCIEFELSWNNDVDFDLALANGTEAKAPLQAFRFEVQGASLVVLRETALEADIAKVLTIEPGAGRVHLRVFLDQARGRLLVHSAEGAPLAELEVPDKDHAPDGIQLVNKKGDLRLERLRISRWNGDRPSAVQGGAARAQAADGGILYGDLTAYDSEAHQFILRTSKGDERMDAARVLEIVLAPTEVAPKRIVSTIHHSGMRLGGELLKVEENVAWLKCPGIRESVGCKLENLHTLESIGGERIAPVSEGRKGRLELDGAKLHGWLVDGSASTGGSLVWRPALSDAASPLASGVAGRIVYRKPTATLTATKTVKKSGPGLITQFFGGTVSANPDPVPKSSTSASIIHMRSGNVISAKIISIDEQGVTFSSDSTAATSIPHEQIQALELAPEAPAIKILKPKKERLLTLPRMQRDNPPTHLIRSVNGDYLRGRLVSLDDRELKIELRLETKTLPVSSVARILWLHPVASAAADPPPGEPSAGTRVQAQTSDKGERSSSRLTFVADKFADSTLFGHCEILGNCHVDLKFVDQLLIGEAIERAASGVEFHQWALKAAAEPRATGSGGEGERGEGMESSLIGKPAPDVGLDFVGGGKFRLADYKGKVLVLDFWASWCGPCLQTMPLVDKVAKEFADQDVRLVGINLEEGADRVGLTLERLQLEMRVALDHDGRVAERYGATSIPQTVIIDRDGKVARLFVGGSARFDEQLRDALRSVLAPAPEKRE